MLGAPAKLRASGEQREEFMRFPALACAVLSAGSAHAASISVESTGPDKPPVVVVQGSFEGKDGEQFFTKTGSRWRAMGAASWLEFRSAKRSG